MPAVYPVPAGGYGWWWIRSGGVIPVTPPPTEALPEQEGYTVVVHFAGESITIRPVRQPISYRLQVWGEADITKSITLDAPWGVDVPALLLEGHRLRGSRAEVYSPRGDLVLAGYVKGATIGRVGAPVSFTIDQYTETSALFPDMFSSSLRVLDQDATDALNNAVRDSLTVDSYVIPPGFEINTSTTAGKILAAVDARATRPISPSIGPDSVSAISVYTREQVGRVYPFVFGQPGADIDGRGTYRGAPALPLDNTTNQESILIAGHEVAATQCIVHGPNGKGGYFSETLSISTITDNAGRKVSIVDLSSATRHVPDPAADQPPITPGFDLDNFDGSWWEKEWFISWTGEATPGLLGEVALRMFRASGRQIDWPRMQAELSKLNTYRIDGYIDEQVDPIQWLEEATEVLPVSMVNGPAGLYLWVWDPTEPVRWTFEEAPGLCAVVGEVEIVGERPVNGYRLDYALLDSSDDYVRSAHVQTTRSTISAIHNGYSEVQRESDVIVRDAVAERVSAEFLEFHAESPFRVTVEVLEADYQEVYAGDPCRINLPAWGMDGWGVVEDVSWDGGPFLDLDLLYMPGWRKS